MSRTIEIVGGGLAGLTAGIILRRAGVPVIIHEAGKYPRHRVCGEFISGQGREVLRELEAENLLRASGAREATTSTFFVSHGRKIRRALPEPALCVPRITLDSCLADIFRGVGGDLRENSRHAGTGLKEGTVRATGRRAVAREEGWRLFGVKVHALEARMESDLEMHFLREGYVGLCRLGANRVNVCALFRTREAVGDLKNEWERWLTKSPALAEAFSGATFDQESLSFVGGLPWLPLAEANPGEVRLGDSIAMIPPITGNGMSLAMESARLACSPLTDYAWGRCNWEDVIGRVAREQKRAFHRRLQWAAMIQRLVFSPGLMRFLPPILGLPRVWNSLFARTRAVKT